LLDTTRDAANGLPCNIADALSYCASTFNEAFANSANSLTNPGTDRAEKLIELIFDGKKLGGHFMVIALDGQTNQVTEFIQIRTA
jgi:hypothetical protein